MKAAWLLTGITREKKMTAESVFEQIRESLNGRPGQPIVLGVCKSLAERFDKEPWVFRLVAIALALFWTLPAVAAYVILGFVLSETEVRTRQFFSGLAVIIREGVEKFASWLRDTLQGANGNGSGNRNY
jgi:phage shock protein PspC (stress-responsive transcriptional regulator)